MVKMLGWDKIIEYASILVFGSTVIFKIGKQTKAMELDHIALNDINEKINQHFNPENSKQQIIKRSDCLLQQEHMEKLFKLMEESLIKTIQLELRK